MKKLFEGRLGIFHYFWGLFAIGIVGLAVSSIISIIFRDIAVLYHEYNYFILYSIFFLFYLNLSTRRLHDIGLSGYLALILILQYVVEIMTIFIPSSPALFIMSFLGYPSFILFLVLIFKKGTDGPNKYGEKLPKDIRFIDAILNKTNTINNNNI